MPSRLVNTGVVSRMRLLAARRFRTSQATTTAKVSVNSRACPVRMVE
jgi:hypothetical protein